MSRGQRCNVINTRVDGATGWVTVDKPRRGSELHSVQRKALDAVINHIGNPAVQTIVVIDLPTPVLSGWPGSESHDDERVLVAQRRRASEMLWNSAKTLVVRRRDQSATATADAPAYISPLTGREQQVLYMASEGASAREIGARLFISERTVESHVNNGYRKLGINSRIELVRRAAMFGL